MTIVDFLNARNDEREQAARSAAFLGFEHWRTVERGSEVAVVWDDNDSLIVPDTGVEQCDHIALNDPEYVLADIAAKRFALDTLRQHEPSDEWGTEPDMGKRSNNCAGAVRRMALPFAGHPGYDPEWAPS